MEGFEMICKECKRNEEVEDGYCEHCIVYQKDPNKDNPLPHIYLDDEGVEHLIFNRNKLKEGKHYPIFWNKGNYEIVKNQGYIELYIWKNDLK